MSNLQPPLALYIANMQSKIVFLNAMRDLKLSIPTDVALWTWTNCR